MRKTLTSILITAFMLITPYSSADEVKSSFQGLTLNANLELADESSFNRVVLITHGTLAHNGMEIISNWQSLLLDEDITSLAINLSLGQDNRHGMYDCPSLHTHKHSDAINEIDHWVNWLKTKGAKQIILAGHSRGGNQTAWYSTEHSNDLITAQILLAPQTWSEDHEAQGYAKRYQQPLSLLLTKAQSLPEDTVLDKTSFIYCENTQVTAASFVSYYAPDMRLDTPTLLKNAQLPTLVFSGSEDTTVANLSARLATIENPQLKKIEIEGADHFFRDLYMDEVIEASLEFIDGL